MDYGHEQTDKELKKLEKRITEEYEKAYKEVKKKADDYFKQFQKADAEKKKLVDAKLMSEKDYLAWRQSAMLTGKRWDDMADVLAKDMVNADKIAAAVIGERLPDTYALNANYGTYEIEHGLGIDTSWTMYDHSTVENLMRDDPQMIPKPRVDIPKDMRWNRQKITSAIAQGVLQGDSIPDIAKRLRSVTNMDRNAAIRNARTYTTAAENKGRIDSYQRAKELGIDLQKEWMATPDGRTRDSHVDLDGERVDIDATFSNGCRYPADPIGEPAEVYNCRCTLVAAVKGRHYHDDRFTRLPEGMTYEDWKAHKLKDDKDSETATRTVVNGVDMSSTWKRREDKFDFAIDDVINAQGFDGKPRVVSREEFDKAVEKSGIIAKRGYTAPSQEVLNEYHKQLINGKWYVDCSNGGAMNGQGMYAVGTYGKELNEHMQSVVDGYGASGLSVDGRCGKIETFTFDPSVKIIKNEDVAFERQNMMYKFTKELLNEDLSNNDDLILKMMTNYRLSNDELNQVFTLPPDEMRVMADKIKPLREAAAKKVEALPWDQGVFCTELGYDAIEVNVDAHGGKHFVVLNRTKCIFLEE